MDNFLSLHTPGVSKRKEVKQRQKLKKKMRYFAQETNGNDTVSGSELVMRKKKGSRDQHEVIQTLLGLVSKTSKLVTKTFSKINTEKQLIPNGNDAEVIENSECNLKTIGSSSNSQKNGEVYSRDDPCNKKKKSTLEENEAGNKILMRGAKPQFLLSLEANDKDIVKKTPNKYILDDDVPLSIVIENISQNSSKSMKESLQDSRYTNDNQLRKTNKKHSVSQGRQTCVINEKEKVEDGTGQKHFKTAKLHEAASVVESNKILTNHHNSTKEKCTLTDVQNVSLKHKSETKVIYRPDLVKNDPNNLVQVLSEVDLSSEKVSEYGVSFKNSCNVQNNRENRMSGEWNVQNTDTHMHKNITPLISPQRSKTKKKLSSNIPEDDGMGSIHSELRQKTNSMEMKGKYSETEMESVSSVLKVAKSKNESTEYVEEACHSRPIIVEMSVDHNVPSNPIHNDLKMKNVASMFNLKSDVSWRPSSNIRGSENWEVQYGNSDNLPEVGSHNLGSKNKRFNIEYEETDISLAKNNPHFVGESVKEDNPYNLYDLFDISDSEAVVALPPNRSLFFKGVLKVKVLVGKITVLGHEISRTSEEYTVYSPYGVSLPALQACTKQDASLSTEKYWRLVGDTINKLKKKEKFLIQERILHKVPEFSSILLFQRVSETLISFLGKYLPTLRFPSAMSVSRPGEDASGTLRVLFVDPRSTDEKLYREPSTWDSLIQFLLKRESGMMRVIACGGKGVGKSTCLRFLINRTLSKCKEVLYIDFDPGQCEFSTPGCVSATIVKNPLLGPNFTHLTHPERMVYVGEVDVSRCSIHYLQSVKFIFDWCCSQAHLLKMPWFINTMGFARGLGVELTVSIIKMVNPSDLIQIDSSAKKRNYPFHLNLKNVQNHITNLHSLSHKEEKALGYSFHLVPSAAESPENRNSPWGIQANVARETTIMSYFSQIAAPPAFSLLEVAPYKLPFSRLKLCVSHEKIRFCDYLLAMNANLVGLCDAKNVQSLKPNNPEFPEIVVRPPICHCVGFGIVRGVDLEKKVFYIITPIEPRKLKIVNCLVLGSVHLPESVYTFQDEAQGTIPYVVEGALLPLVRGVRAAKSVVKLRK